MSIARSEVIEAARSWLGTPFHHQGRVRGVGVDCAGVIVGVARELGLSEVDATGYGHRPDSRELERLCHAHMTPVAIEAAQPGDVLLLTIEGLPQHLAFLTELGGERAMLHAYAPARRVVEHRIDAVWAERIVAAFVLPGVE
jgi:NlpC/P60 family putative phage cell wall peptidase